MVYTLTISGNPKQVEIVRKMLSAHCPKRGLTMKLEAKPGRAPKQEKPKAKPGPKPKVTKVSNTGAQAENETQETNPKAEKPEVKTEVEKD